MARAGAGPAPAAPMPAWAVVVVNYESGPLLLDCLRSASADTSAGGPPEVVVVDNGSRDGWVARAEHDLAGLRVVRPGANLGYAGAANAGIAATAAPVIAVVNPDARLEPGSARALLARFDAEPDLGALGPRVRDPDGTTYPSARRDPSAVAAAGHALLGAWLPGNPWTRRYRALDADPAVPRDVDWVSGAAIWLRRTALDSVGGWDAGYFMYVEDADLCWRLRRAGWRVGYEPAAAVVHVRGTSAARHPYRMLVEHHRSSLRFLAKRWTGWHRALLVPAALLLGVRLAGALGAEGLRARRGAGKGTG